MVQIKLQYIGLNFQESVMIEKRLLNMIISLLDRLVMVKLIVSRLDSFFLRIRLVNIVTIIVRFLQMEKIIIIVKEKVRKVFFILFFSIKRVFVLQLLFIEYVELGIIIFIFSFYFIFVYWGLCIVVLLRLILF